MEVSDCGENNPLPTPSRTLRLIIARTMFLACIAIFLTQNLSAQPGRRGGARRPPPPTAATPTDAPSATVAPDEPPPPAAAPQRQTSTPRTQRAAQPQTRTISQEEPYTDTASIETGGTREYNLTAREGETVIVAVTSSNFNPMVEIVSASGGRIAQNDDVRAGEQDAVLLARLSSAGAYRLRVTASPSASGAQTRAGEYEITVRRFVPVQAEVGGRVEGTLGTGLKQWHRFSADAGQTLVVAARSSAFPATVEIYAQNGEAVAPESVDVGAGEGESGGVLVFRAQQAGTYYARIAPTTGGQAGNNYSLTIAPVRTAPLAAGGTSAARRLDAGGFDIYTFQGATGEVVRVTARTEGAAGVTVRIVPATSGDGAAIPEAADAAPDGQRRRGRANQPSSSSSTEVTLIPSVTALPVSTKATGEAVALLAAAGTYQVVVSQASGLPVEYTLATSRPLNTFRNEGESTGTLALGSSDFWAIDGGAGGQGIARIEGLSDQFDARLEIYGPSGGLLGANDDGAGGRNAGLSFLMNDPGRYILRIHSLGDGGSGTYRLRRGANPARRLTLGERTEGVLQPDGTEIYSFQGRAGQSVIITVRSTAFDPKVALHAPDGSEVGSDDDGGGGTDSLLTRRLPADGTYTVWVTPFSGSGQFTLRVIED